MIEQTILRLWFDMPLRPLCRHCYEVHRFFCHWNSFTDQWCLDSKTWHTSGPKIALQNLNPFTFFGKNVLPATRENLGMGYTMCRFGKKNTRVDSRFAPSQWETALLCKDVSHWLGTSLAGRLSLCYATLHWHDSRALNAGFPRGTFL